VLRIRPTEEYIERTEVDIAMANFH